MSNKATYPVETGDPSNPSISYPVKTGDPSNSSLPQSVQPDTKDIGNITSSLSRDCSVSLELQPSEIHQSTSHCSQDDSERVLPMSPMTTDWLSIANQLLSILEGAVHSRVIRAPVIPSRIYDSTRLPIPDGNKDCAASQISPSMDDKDPPTSSHTSHRASLSGTLSQPECCLTEKQFETRQDVLSSEASVVSTIRTRSDDVCPGVVEGRAKVAVLFSGGVDSAVLAALTDRLVG